MRINYDRTCSSTDISLLGKVKSVVMKAEKQFELLNNETIQMPFIFAQGFPIAIAFVILMIFQIVDESFQIGANNPYLFDLIIGISVLIASLSFLVTIIEKEIVIALLAIRGKIAVLIGLLGLAACWLLGIGMIIQYFNDIATLK